MKAWWASAHKRARREVRRVAVCLILLAAVVAGPSTPVARGGTDYQYDSAGRLKGVTYPNGAQVNYFYDSAGNRTSIQAIMPNAPPTAQNDTGLTTLSSADLTFDPRGNDTDPENGVLTVVSVANAINGTATIINGGTAVRFTPTPNYVGPASYSYAIADPIGATASATVAITVQNRPPVFVANTTKQIASNTTSTPSSAAIALTDNFVDPEGRALRVYQVTGTANGTEIHAPDTAITFIPTLNYVGTAGSVSYRVMDDAGAPSASAATVTVQVANRAPVVGPMVVILPASSATTTFNPLDFFGDPDGHTPLTVVEATAATGGVVTWAGTVATFTAPANFTGGAQFSYKLKDALNATSVLATVTVNTNNLPPVANPDSVSVVSNTGNNSSVTFDPRGNDTDPENSPLTIVGATGTNGVATVNGGVSVTFVPALNFVGAASYTYTVADPQGATASATVNVTVNNRAPVANTDNVTTLSNQAATTSVLANDADPEGGGLTLVSVQSAVNGAVVMSGATATFTPAANFVGSGSYTYTIRDPQNATATATVYVTVQNRAPIAVADSTSTLRNAALTFDPRGNDTDPEGGALTIVGVSSAVNGTASIGGGGTAIIFSPVANFTGAASFSYTIQDPFGASSTASVSIDVQPPPVSVTNPSFTVGSASTTVFALSQLASVNGSGSIFSFTPSLGTATLAGDGQSVSYRAPANNVTWCDQGTASAIQVNVPYVIRHTATGVNYSGNAIIFVNYTVLGGPPKGGCP